MDNFFASSRTLYRNLLTSLRQFALTTNDEEYPQYCLVSHASYSPWRNDAAFLEAHAKIRDRTLVDIYRCYEIWTQIGQLSAVPGAILEVGVWKGGTSALISLALKHFGISRQVYAADTFHGVVKAGRLDTRYRGGEHSDCSEADVRDFLAEMGEQIEILTGIYPEDFIGHQAISTSLAFTHIDVDTHDSAKEIFESVWGRTSVGGTVIFDDYGFWGCEGVTRMVNELRIANARMLYNLNGHAILIKLAEPHAR
jgi:O-methyltransferase